jgi:SNW domain-containing protein 1
MGREGKESTSNALAVQLDAQGKIKYDVLARQGHSKDKVIFLIFSLDQTESTRY